MGHHYAIRASDSDILLAQKKNLGPAKGWPHFRHCNVYKNQQSRQTGSRNPMGPLFNVILVQ
jgi:hypothetical protein